MKLRLMAGSLGLLWVVAMAAATASAGNIERAHESEPGPVYDGRLLDALQFFLPHAGGNGRSCATCHRPEDGFGLTPATVEARYQRLLALRRENPSADDPLFRSIDADDLGHDFTTLRTKGLVRVRLPLAPNVVIADDPTARSVLVWRAVPTVMNTRLTAPFQAEGRQATLPDQAVAAMHEHSEIAADADGRVLTRLARFQEHLFSSGRVLRLARAWTTGGVLPSTDPPLTELERQGKTTFAEFCGKCHGGPTQTVNADGTFLPVPQRGPLPGAQAFVNVFVQTPRVPPGPPVPPFFDGLPTANLEERTYIVTLPNGATQTFVTSDPGRGAVTGDAREFGRFDVPTLFGVAQTAPYFHDNSAATLEDVVRHYQRVFELLTYFADRNLFAPPIDGQGCSAADCTFRPLPDADVAALLAYVRRL
jgi:cytochrome c peroxidase